MPYFRRGTTEEQKKAKKDQYRATYRARHPDRHKESCQKYHEKHREELRVKEKARSLRRNAQLRKEWLEAYGAKCACCGETEPKFLTVEHLNGDGKQHRKEIKSTYILPWLKRQGWPKDRFSILCCNCNFSKGRYGACPHTLR